MIEEFSPGDAIPDTKIMGIEWKTPVDKTCRSTVYITPDRILDPVKRFFHGKIELDPATEPNNPTDAVHFFTEADDGLKRDWGSLKTFVNPPYGRALKAWTEKIRLESFEGGPIVALLPGQRFETEYWQKNVLSERLSYCVLIRKRINFFRPDGELAKGNPYGSMLYIFNADSEFWVKECFGHLGKIWVAKFL